MNTLRKFGLRVSFGTVTLGIILLCAMLFGDQNAVQYQILAIYLFVSSVFFASPHMIITHENETQKPRLETYADFVVSGFYTTALIYVLYNAIPYFNSGGTVTTLEMAGQVVLVISFLWTLCLHGWSAISNLIGVLKLKER